MTNPWRSDAFGPDELIQATIILLPEAEYIDNALGLSATGEAYFALIATKYGQGAQNLLGHFLARQLCTLVRDADDLLCPTEQEVG